jgi:hypothetical protein
MSTSVDVQQCPIEQAREQNRDIRGTSAVWMINILQAVNI